MADSLGYKEAFFARVRATIAGRSAFIPDDGFLEREYQLHVLHIAEHDRVRPAWAGLAERERQARNKRRAHQRFRKREAKRLAAAAVSGVATTYPTPEPLASAAAGVGMPSTLLLHVGSEEEYRLWCVYTGRLPATTGVEWQAARRWAMAISQERAPAELTERYVAVIDPAHPPEPDMAAAIRDVARGS